MGEGVGLTDVRALDLEGAGFYPCYLLAERLSDRRTVRFEGDADRSLARPGPWVGPDGVTQLKRTTISVRLRVPLLVGEVRYEPGDWVLWPLDRVEFLH